ncbi:GNAT family N-acetyltransferase [Robbsia sp. Bb-Pol-6]|uniref:GNAT family N-acetyltransferase n=1 Tax=Robbsia betulipollinis TaxID=2981849 RepID=A0ABT3ZTA0_9BURK|nr:GNAT family N-acetyltransferase [Robbsia betulipollinis]MCY0389697.1 GNAT family N-acetyltransferase [Robbsia betulipollinis]
MEQTILIRPVERRDLAAWRVLWDGYNAFYGRSGETALSEETVLTTWTRFFDGYEPVHCLIAESGGRVVGLAHYLFHRSTIRIGPSCYLQDLFVADAARGAGAGRALLEAASAQAKAGGAVRLYWQTRNTNAAAMRLYASVADPSDAVTYRRTL